VSAIILDALLLRTISRGIQCNEEAKETEI